MSQELETLSNEIANLISIPSSIDKTNKNSIKFEPVSDASILTCGCLISERFAKSLYISPTIEKLTCPTCHSTTKILNSVEPLRNIFSYLNLSDPEFNTIGNNKKESLLSLFYSIATSIDSEQKEEKQQQQQPQQSLNEHLINNSNYNNTNTNTTNYQKSISLSVESANTIPLANDNYSSISNKSGIIPTTNQPPLDRLSSHGQSSGHASTYQHQQQQQHQHLQQQQQQHQQQQQQLLVQQHGNYHSQPNSIEEQKEYLYVKCFPTYRRHFQYPTHSKFFKTKSKIFINTAISPNCKFFTLLSSKKWEVYKISSDSSSPPILYCCGNNRGEYGLNFENLENYSINDSNEFRGGGLSLQNDPENVEFKSKLSNWEHLYCSMNDDLLVISGTNGIIRVFDLNKFGKPIYIYSSNFPIRCIDISSNSNLIAYGITGKDRINGNEQALIVMHRLTFKQNNDQVIPPAPPTSSSTSINSKNSSKFNSKIKPSTSNNTKYGLLKNWTLENVDPITITFPYSDPINHVSFSKDSNFLSCSTALESRFLTVLVKDPSKPRLIMKSIRTLDTSLESEGITSVKMFPNNKFMIITSVAFNSTPIIIDNNISLIYKNELQSIAQPKLILKIDEVGSNIHNATISPRNDSIAMIDRDGTVYLLFATKMNQESKRLFIVDQVSNAFRARESASLSFSPDGHRLYIVDRKGVLYINDFAAGLPQNPEITRCKVVNID